MDDVAKDIRLWAGEDGFDPRYLFEYNRCGVLLTEAEDEGVVSEANPMACGLLRCKRRDLVGRRVLEDLFDPSDERLAAAREEQRRFGRFEGVLRVLRGDGTSFDSEVTFASYDAVEEEREAGDRGGSFVALRDLVPRIARDPGEWNTSPIRYTADLVVVFEENGAMRYASPSMERIMGYKPEEVVGKLTRDLVHSDDVAGMVDTMIDIFFNPAGTDTPLAFRARCKGGGWVHLEGVANNLLDDPAVEGVVVSFRDVTGRVQAEEEARRREEDLRRRAARNEARLRESEERFRATFEQAAVGMAHLDLDGRWLRVNPKLCETVGYGCEELQKKTFQDITHPDDLDADIEQVGRLLEGEIDEYSTDKRYIRKDGSHLWINLRVSLVREPSGEPVHFVSVVEDIDERKKAELILGSLTPREEESTLR